MDLEQLVNEEDMEELVASGLSHRGISEILCDRFPGHRGLSERSVRRYCEKYDIHWTSSVETSELDRAVSQAVDKLGPTYGRKTMKGYLSSHHGWTGIGEKRVGRALQRVAPEYHEERQQTAARRANPVPYSAEYFGHKLHVDQNEKLTMYGVTHVAAIDGLSGCIVQTATMPMKNNYVIYDQLLKPILLQYGVWDQLRVDHGLEFVLMLYVQEQLEVFRSNRQRQCFVQSDSKHNHPIERIWGEVNQRVNFPIKAGLNDLVDKEILDLNDEISKFSVSAVAIEISRVGMTSFVEAWNAHPISGKGIPNILKTHSNVGEINPTNVPSLQDAVQGYEAGGGRLTGPHSFGTDILRDSPLKASERNIEFHQRYDAEDIFSKVVNGQYDLMQQAVVFYDRLTRSLL